MVRRMLGWGRFGADSGAGAKPWRPLLTAVALFALAVLIGGCAAGTGTGVDSAGKGAAASQAAAIERSEETEQKKEAAEISNDREVLAALEGKKREESGEANAAKTEAEAVAKAKTRLQEAETQAKQKEAQARAKAKKLESSRQTASHTTTSSNTSSATHETHAA